MFEILHKERIGPGVNRAVISAPDIARAHKPGQFIILRTHDEGERIPLTVADKDAEKGTITLIWQEVGVTTYYMGTMAVGESLHDLCGPLGKADPYREIRQRGGRWRRHRRSTAYSL